MGEVNFLKIKRAFKLLKDALVELEEVESFVELLEEELNEYKSLIDRESYVPKFRLVKARISRLIERIKFVEEESLGCIGIKFLIKGDVSSNDRRELLNYIISYIDSRVRPYDMVFLVDENVVGLLVPLKARKDIEAVARRLENMLFNIKAQTYSSKSILLNFKLDSFLIEKESSADEVFNRLINSK
ncbi:hypothetical protein [Thermovibrio sp.]